MKIFKISTVLGKINLFFYSNFHLASTSLGMAINNIDRLNGSGVDSIDTGSGQIACSNGVVYERLTDQYQNEFGILPPTYSSTWTTSTHGTYDNNLQGKPRGNYNIRSNYDRGQSYGVGATVGHTYDQGKGNWNAHADYNRRGSSNNYRVGADVSHTFGRNDRGEVSVNGNVDTQGNYGVGAGVSWKF